MSYVCPRCMTQMHEPPACEHNAEAPCRSCGGPRGYRWQVQPGQLFEPADTCWRCAFVAGLVPQ